MDRQVIERLFSKITKIHKIDGTRSLWEGYRLVLPEGQLYCDPHRVYFGVPWEENDSGLTEEEAGALYAMVEEKCPRRMKTRRTEFLRKFGLSP